MAITFIKPQKFDPKNVKNIDFDIDENWLAKDLNFISESKDDDTTKTYDYSLQLLHKKTQQMSPRMRICITLHDKRIYNNYQTEVRIVEMDNEYDYGHSYHLFKHRNVFIFLKHAVTNIDFIKSMYHKRYTPQRELFKSFGKIFMKESL